MLYHTILDLTQYDHRDFTAIMIDLANLVPYHNQEENDGRRFEDDYAFSSLADEPYIYDLPYHFDRMKAIRSPTGYVGLKNLSNTCYLNSLLTQLFMNVGFRQFIAQLPVRAPMTSQQLLLETQKTFGFMQESYGRYVDPTDLVACIKTYDDSPVDIHNQMDVDEFYSLLFDRWEGQIPSDEDKKKLRSFYGGQLVQQVKSKECEHISERLEPFSAIQCDIKGKNTLQDSPQAYVDGEIMEGGERLWFFGLCTGD